MLEAPLGIYAPEEYNYKLHADGDYKGGGLMQRLQFSESWG